MIAPGFAGPSRSCLTTTTMPQKAIVLMRPDAHTKNA